VIVEETNAVELVGGGTLRPMQARMVSILSDGKAIEPSNLLRRVGSRASGSKSITSAIRTLRAALAGSGIVVETDADGRVFMDGASCILAQAIVGAAW
jgi:hypothetical protein